MWLFGMVKQTFKHHLSLLKTKLLVYLQHTNHKEEKSQFWYDKETYKRRNEAERLFNRLKNFRCIAARYEKLALTFTACILIGLILLILK